MDEFLLRALIGGLGVAALCGPLGCLVVWQRMSYFGAALSHAALLGIALGLFFQINLQLSVVLICVVASLLLMFLERNKSLTSDTALAILAHGSLAFGLLVLAILPGIRMDLMGYLFGDVLSISWRDVVIIYTGGFVVASSLLWIWPRIMSLIIQRDLALVDGVNEQRTRMIFLVLLSVVVAISMQIVGILLVVSLLIIPAACARRFAKSPESMVLIASIVGAISVILGLFMSLFWNTPAGPSIVTAACLLFILSLVTPQTRKAT